MPGEAKASRFGNLMKTLTRGWTLAGRSSRSLSSRAWFRKLSSISLSM
jgi:hypothetical protein